MTARTVQRRLPCGTRVVAELRPEATSAAVAWFVGVGSRDEPAALAGVSHFLEHMAFKGAAGLDAERLNRRLDALGARANAYTAEDRTAYYGTVLPEHLSELNALLGAMTAPTLRDGDVATERQVILEEIAMSEDDPESRAFEAAAAAYFGDHSLGRPILGTRESVGAIAHDDLERWCRERYRPQHRVVALAGRLDLERELDVVAAASEAAAGGAGDADGASAFRREPATPRPGATRSGDPRLRRVYGTLLAPGVAADAPERIAAALLARVLGEPGESALHWALVDPGLADDAGLAHDPGDGFGTFAGWWSAAPRREEEVRERFLTVLRSAQDAPVDRAAWQRARRTLATETMLAAETPHGRVMSLGDDVIERGRVIPPDERVERILRCPADAGDALLASRPFDRGHLATLGPPGG